MKQRNIFRKILWFGFVFFAVALSTAVTFAVVSSDSNLLGAKFGEAFDEAAQAWEGKQGQEPVTMLFTGDMMLGRYIAVLSERNAETAPDFPFTYMPDILTEAASRLDLESADEIDLVVGNLEGPITNSTYVNPGTSMIFNFQPEVADLLAKVGFTTLDMANNHVFNQGRQGLDQTYNYLQAAGLEGFGHPDTPDGAYSFTSYEFPTMTIGFLGLNDTDYALDEDGARAKIAQLNEEVDFLVVGIHWGVEYEVAARDWMVDLAHSFVDSGADMVWGHHPHVIQNWELYQGAPIYYSLGNFVFDQYWSAATQEGLVVAIKIEGDKITTSEIYVDLVNQGEPKVREEVL